MTRIVLEIPSPSDVSASGLGKDSPFYNPRSGGSLYAAYALGSDYGDPTEDLSGNGRDLTLTTGAFGTRYLTGSASAYCTVPFSSATLGAVNSQMTWVILEQTIGSNQALFISSGTGLPSVSLSAQTNSTATANNRDASNTAAGQWGTANKVAGVTGITGGTGYADSFAVSFSGGSGSGAAGIAFASGGVVTEVHITEQGASYATAPSIDFSAGGGSGASATVVLGRAPDAETRWKMVSGVYTPTSSKIRLGWGDPTVRAPQTHTNTKATGTFGSSGNLQVGYYGATGFTSGQVRIMAALFYNVALTDAELNTLQGNLEDVFGPYGDLDWS